jgi:hypothetical protein
MDVLVEALQTIAPQEKIVAFAIAWECAAVSMHVTMSAPFALDLRPEARGHWFYSNGQKPPCKSFT